MFCQGVDRQKQRTYGVIPSLLLAGAAERSTTGGLSMMRLHRVLAVVVACSFVAVSAPVVAQGNDKSPPAANASLQMYEAVVDGATAARIADDGYDVVSTEQVQGGVRIVLVLYPWQRKALEKQGIDLALWTNTEGVTATELAKQQEDAGFKVFRPYDGPKGIRAYMTQLAAANP